jgi:hypothetical protein
VQFADDPVREYRTTPARSVLQMLLAFEGWRGTGLPAEMQTAVMEESLTRFFAGPAPAEVRGELAERLAWYDENAGFVRSDGVGWYVDTDARALGLPTNDLAFLDACLKQPDERAALLWERYTGRPLDDVALERAWLAARREHLYFTDWGGYRWVSLLDAPMPIPPRAVDVAPVVTATLGAARYGDDVRVLLLLTVPAGFHAYAPGSTDGLPLEVTVGGGLELVELQAASEDGHLTGASLCQLLVRGPDDDLDLDVRVQLCDDLTCYSPQTLSLRCPIAEGTA